MWNSQVVTIGPYSFHLEWQYTPSMDIDVKSIQVSPTESDISEMLEVYANQLYLDIIANIDTSQVNDTFEE